MDLILIFILGFAVGWVMCERSLIEEGFEIDEDDEDDIEYL